MLRTQCGTQPTPDLLSGSRVLPPGVLWPSALPTKNPIGCEPLPGKVMFVVECAFPRA